MSKEVQVLAEDPTLVLNVQSNLHLVRDFLDMWTEFLPLDRSVVSSESIFALKFLVDQTINDLETIAKSGYKLLV